VIPLSANPADPWRPPDGDVIVGRDSRSGVKYTVRQAPGDVQFHASVRDEAIRLARSFAVRAAVDVWYIDADTCRLLEAYRRKGPGHEH